MPSVIRYLLVTTFLLVTSFSWVQAQPMVRDDNSRSYAAPLAQAVHVETSPLIDGNVLSDPVWAESEVIEGFWQTTPDEGEPASERTEIKIVYTDEALYVGVICYDEDPSRLIITEARRDGDLNGNDSFRFVLDTYRDSQNGFVFGTTPAGIEYDAQITDEGRGSGGFSGQQSGSMGGFNINWDASWEVKTKVEDYGWTAEFAIPFSTLRFPRKEVQTWGLNFQRNIRHRNEIAYWAKLPRQYNLFRVSMAGSLEGLQIPDPRNLKITPYVLTQSVVDRISEADANPFDVGVDAKYSITPSLALDLTVNTDFAQVEVDEEQINLDRFSLFFPEKRPFFLENAGLFSIGSAQATGRGSEVEMFFSRRIGIGANGSTVPILGGARVSGNVGGASVGLLNMQTREVEGVTESNNFSVARVEQELKNRSAIGVMFVNREGINDLSTGINNTYNRLFAIDGKIGIGADGEVNTYFARSFSPHLSGDEYAYDFSFSQNIGALLLTGQYAYLAENFNPEVGFLGRGNFRKLQGLIFYRHRPRDNAIGMLEMRPHVSYRGYWGSADGFHETNYLHVDTHWEWRSGFEIHTGVNFRMEGVRDDFSISDGVIVPGDSYSWAEAQLVLMTDDSAPISFSTRTFIGGFFGGDRFSTTSGLNFRAGEKFNSELSVQYNDVNLPFGDFRSNLFRTRLAYTFTPRIFLQGLVQYNDQNEFWSMNVRFGWLQTANTGLYLVFNQSNAFDFLADSEDRFLFYGVGDLRNRSITLKYTYQFDVFR